MRAHLRLQALAVAGLHYPQYAEPAQLEAHIDAALDGDADAVLFDVASEGDLAVIGGVIWQRALRQALLAIGASSVVQSLAAWWRSQGWVPPATPVDAARINAATGPVFVLAGSLSPMTAVQVGAAHSYDKLLLDPQRLFEGDMPYMEVAVARIVTGLREGRNMLACIAERQLLADAGASQRLAQACGELLRRLLQAYPLARVGVAGGDTSSYALKALDIWGLSYLGNVSAGVALCRAHADAIHLDGIELMLKGGQMGTADLFELLVRGNA